jgi:hypothetical protein
MTANKWQLKIMALSSKFYRNNLIKLAILTAAYVVILVEFLRGKAHPDTEPGAIIFLGVLAVVGNVGLFVAMRRAKRREQAEANNSPHH